jgi:hypothetical protein
MPDALKDTLEIYRQKEKQLLSQLQSVRFMIKNLEADAGVTTELNANESVVPVENSLDESESAPVQIASPSGRKPQLRPDEFFGMTQADAARAYLKKVGHAVSFDELAEALQAGGCKVSGANTKKVLYISLVRNTRDFVPPRAGFIGLREFYPAGARVAPPKPKARPKSRQKKAKKSAVSGKSKAKPETKAAPISGQPSALAQTVKAIMSDNQPRSPKEIVEKVSEKLGQVVQPIGVYGILRNSKGYEKIDGQYRLVS